MRKQVVILAGGLGTRLRPLTEKCPKPLVPVAGEPYLHWQMLELKERGYTDVVLLVAYLGEMIEQHFGDGQSLGMQIEYAYEREPLGTGGALKNALELLEDEFILMNGDSFLPVELDDLAGDFDAGRYEAMVAAYDNSVPTPVKNNLLVKNGTVWEYRREAGAESGFGYVDAGVYCLKKSVIANFQAGAKFQLEDVWKPLIAARQLGAFVVRERFYDIGTPERLAEFEAYVRAESARGRFSGREPEGRP